MSNKNEINFAHPIWHPKVQSGTVPLSKAVATTVVDDQLNVITPTKSTVPDNERERFLWSAIEARLKDLDARLRNVEQQINA
jgi:hypothetical protein